MSNRKDYSWKNQLLFPLLCASSFLHAWLLQQPIFILIGCYFLGIICCKKQVTLVLLAVFCSFFVFLRAQQTKLQPVPIEKELVTKVHIFPDTIQLNGDLVNFEGSLSQGNIKGQYKLATEQEKNQWKIRKNWSKIIKVKGSFREIEQLRNQHGFHAQRFYFSTNQLGVFVIDEIISEKDASGFAVLRKIRASCIDWLEENFPEKISTYFLALLVGYKSRDFHEIQDIYSSSGILHFFTISGSHVYLFYGWFLQLLRRTRLTFNEFSLISCIGIFFGIFLFGQEVSVLRASFLYLLNLFFKERQIHLSRMDRFSIVLFVLLLLDPKTLLQLSGILSLGMSWFILIQNDGDNRFFAQLWRSQVVSVLAAPIFMYTFFELPLLGGILTTVCGPFFTIFLPFSLFLCGFTLLGVPVSGLTNLLLYFIQGFEGLLRLTKSLVWVTGQPAMFSVVVAVISSLLLYHYHRKWLLFLPTFILIGSQLLSFETSVSFVDVGQGDSTVIQSPFKKEVYVIDTGGRLSFEQEAWQQRTYRSGAEYTLLPFLKGEGVRQIDGLFLTHGDADHLGDAAKVIEKIPVKWVYVGKGSLQHPSIQRLAKHLPKRTKIREVEMNEIIGKRVSLQVLAPKFGKGENEDSLVLTTKIRGMRFLMTGDLGKEGERKLLKDYPNLKVDVMKLGHHGSKTSTDYQFIAQIQLKEGIISCGKNNRFNHPHPEVLETLTANHVRVFRTDQSGMVRYLWGIKEQQPRLWLAKDY